jgi:uncharacterized membrane protein
MRLSYTHIAGQSLERLAALSDGIFAVAMTLLVLDLAVPAGEAIQSQRPLWESGAIQDEAPLWNALAQITPHLLPYLMSFLTLGIFWLGQQTQLNHFSRSNRTLAWIHLVFLLAVTLMPFSTGLLAGFVNSRLAIVIYWLNLLFLGVMLFISWRYARRAGLAKEEVTDEISAATERRIVIYQGLYAFGAALCIINTYVSIVFLILMQLNSIIAPRIGKLNRF